MLYAYTTPIEFAQLQINLEKARQVNPFLHKDVALFLARVGADAAAA